jgi:hypothetical protein
MLLQLEHNLNEMDIKIGLLVRNRIELQDVVKQSKLLKKQHALGKVRSVKKMKKEKRKEKHVLIFFLFFPSLFFLSCIRWDRRTSCWVPTCAP